MANVENKPFSVRDWLGVTAGIGGGLVLGRFFGLGDMSGVWLVILLGPPVMLLISPARPILGWQVPILAATVSSTLMYRDPQDTAGLTLFDAAVVWFICSLFSSPWALIFRHRAKRVNEQGTVKQVTASYVGLGLLVFLACTLTIVGFAGTLYPVDSSDPGSRSLPFYGFLMATAGVGLSTASFQVARKLGVNKPVTDMLQLLLLLPSIFGVTALLAFFYDVFMSTGHPGTDSPYGEIWLTLAGLEALAILLWMTRAHRRERTRPS